MENAKFKLFDDLGTMFIGAKDKAIECLESWTKSDEAKENYSSDELKSIRNHFHANQHKDFISFSGFTLCEANR